MKRLKTMKTIFEIMPKIRRSVTLSEETMDWIYGQIKKKRFKDVSHTLDCAAYRLMEEDREKE
jgi:Arc/MetJ-type ribon-helix-helix transcriptional regulator